MIHLDDELWCSQCFCIHVCFMIFISKDFNKHPSKNTISETLKMVNCITWIATKKQQLSTQSGWSWFIPSIILSPQNSVLQPWPSVLLLEPCRALCLGNCKGENGVLLEGKVFLNWEMCKVRTSFKWQFVITILVYPCASLCLVANRHLSPGRWWGCSGGTGCGGLWCFKSLRLDEQHSANQLRSLTGEFLGYLYNNCI